MPISTSTTTSAASPGAMADPRVAPGKVLVVFDFDKTIMDDDTDDFVVTELSDTVRQWMVERSDWQLTHLMDACMGQLHEEGFKAKDVAEAVSKTPIDPVMVPGLKALRQAGVDLRILSDANTFTINAILEHHDFKATFTEVVTNPGVVDDAGRLRISWFVGNRTHGCPCCVDTPNLCKGEVLERMIAEAQPTRVIYVGDGRNDLCPSLRLTKNDVVLARKGYKLEQAIEDVRHELRADAITWADHSALVELLNLHTGTAVPVAS